MIVRERLEKEEMARLHPRAAKSAESRGRDFPELECDVRTAFQRDRDRIIHSKAFRRLKHKTQVFFSPEGDHYRTRLTHTLEVAQISRTIARALWLNEDLTEAIALGHDLGHTPFGHSGERALDRIRPKGFRHNEQSLRVVEKLEIRSSQYDGLNLTAETRDGILGHTGNRIPATLEGQIVRIADRVAYVNHDIDDAIRSGLLRSDDIPPSITDVLGSHHSERISTTVRDIIENSRNLDSIMMSESVRDAMDSLREFLFSTVYKATRVALEGEKAEAVVTALYEYYMEDPKRIALESGRDTECDEQAVCDWIAGMTDRYALRQYRLYRLS
ncbi:MAG TPA: deoxyguanosinetriphosphate triphosphohydrolase [Bacillota bacterium]|nr:deoxyguanosinetriphosphate triphosphohydrolase [Bacillota bacterium]